MPGRSRQNNELATSVATGAVRLLCTILYLLVAHSSAFAQPSDIGHLIRSRNLEDKVLIPHQIETSLQELNTQPIEVNLRAFLEPYAGSRDEVRAVLNILNNPSVLTVSVRLLNSELFDDKVGRDYLDRLKDFAFTGCQRDGFKFLQQVGYAPLREDLWLKLTDSSNEDVERIFTEARSGGEVVLLDRTGKLYRLTKSFSISRLTEKEGLDGVALLGRSAYTDLATIGQTIATAVSEPNRSLFDLSEAIPSIYAFSLRRMGEQSPGSTIQYYVSVGITSPNVEGGETLYEEAAIIPILVKVEQRSEEVCDNGVDDDGDGSVDCGDSDCSSSAACPTPPPSEDCYNSADDDMDGAVDCADSDCASLPSCAPPVEICDNGSDEDGDGSYDCSDSDCYGSPSCVSPSEDCANGIDDDGDWFTDCSDSDCQNTYTCMACSADCPYGGGMCICAPTYWGWGSCSCDCSGCPQQPQNPEFLSLSESQSYPLGCFSDEFSFQARFPVYGDYAVYVDGQNVRNLGWTSGDQSISFSLSPGYHQLGLVNQSGGGSASVTISTYYSCEPEHCSDGYDNNGNGAVDCSDPECSGYWACYSTPENCSDGIDNDNDGATDCSDYECSSASNCSTQPEDCYDGWDNDGDGAVDCNDSDCAGCIVYEQCDNNLDDDYDGFVDCGDPDCATDYRCHPPREYDCANNADDDWDWMIDCADSDCFGHEACIYMPEVCDDNTDNDRDGRIDCEDDDCASQPSCRNYSEICDDGVDNDDDGLIDCEDVEQCACADIELCSREGDEDGNGYADCRDKRCADYPSCGDVVHEVCDNGIDDDGNGELDCDDYWCRGQSVCIPKEICGNGNDDDSDGAIDCSDSDCSSDPSCVPQREDCTNGRDDDGDDQIDGDDSSCRGSEVIPAEGTPLATFDPLFGIRLGDQSPRIVRITDSTWRLETATEDAAPVERTPVRVQIRNGVIEAHFAQEERGIFTEYLAPNTSYRLTVSLRGVDESGKEFTIADHYSHLFTTPDTAVLPAGVVLVRHDLVLEAQDVSTPVPTETPVTVEVECGDSADNDGDGSSDCADSDCSGSPSCITPPEDCSNGSDDDRDGSIDCGDTDCSGSGNCITPPEDCYNSTDDDMDGAADCSDSDCASLPSCAPPVEICDNGSDDDSDGSSDCSDTDCNGSSSCVPPSEDCTNGTDDDGDWSTDCSDSDCQYSSACIACSADCPYGGGSCTCAPTYWGWGSCSCDCSSCPQQPQNPEFLSLSESQSYPLGCFSDQFSFQARLPVYGDYVVYVDGQNVRTLGWTSGDQSVSLSISPGYHQITLVNQSGGGSASVHISTYYSCEPENCSDGYDNNGNGAVDCSDPECSGYWACYSMPENCSDGIDNDNDGAIDCSDYYDCSSASNCTTQPEYCYDGSDNDGDGAVDCNDSDCPGCIVYYEQCDNNLDDDYDGLVDCEDPVCSTDYRCHPPREYDCTDNIDNNWNWLTDCADPECAGHEVCSNPSEICDDSIDNDGDSLIDCEDVEQCACADIELCSQEGDEDGNGYADCRDRRCEFYPACGNVIHEVCDNAIDDDDNGEIDCDDYWCREQAVCIPTEDCANPGDDDGDGAADCDDSDCSSADNCVEKVEDCANGEDDDEDDRIDADDPSCRGSEVIPAEGTPLASFDPIFGIRIREDTAQIASITEWVWRLEALPPREEGGPAADVEPRVLDAVYVEVRDGVIEGFFAYEERGVFKEYLTPNTRYRLTVSLRGFDANGAEIIVADQDTVYFTTPDVAVLPDGVALVRHDVVLGSRAVPTAIPTEVATATPGMTEADCADGMDNDGDGQSDCLDMDCNGNSACYTCVSTGGESCSNGFDDDCDGATDCGDGDCSESVECENGGNTGGTTGGTTGGSTGTTTPSPNIAFVKNIGERDDITITCGEKTFDAEVALPPGGASDRLTLILYEEYYVSQKDPSTGKMVGVKKYAEIQSESFTQFPTSPVVLRFSQKSFGDYRLELVNYLGTKSYQTIVAFHAKEGCAPTETPTEEPDDSTPTCGDKKVQKPSEECDDGNQINDDGCCSDCTSSCCGDGKTDAGEECDDGSRNGPESRCTSGCTWAPTPTPTPKTQVPEDDDNGKDPCDDIDPSSGSAPTGGSQEFSTTEEGEAGIPNRQTQFNFPVVQVGGGSGSGEPDEKPSAVTEKGAPNLSEEEQKNLPTEQMDTFSYEETKDQIMKDPAVAAAEQKAREALDEVYETEERVKAGTATEADLAKARQEHEAAKSAFEDKVDTAAGRLAQDRSYPEWWMAGDSLKREVSYQPQTPRREIEVVPVNGSTQPTTSNPTSPDTSGIKPSAAALANLRTAQAKATRALAGAAMNSQGAQRNFDNSVRLAQNVSLMGQLLGLGDDALKQLRVDRENLERAIARERELQEQQRDLEGAEKEVGEMYEKAAALEKEGYKDAADLVRAQADALAATWADKETSALSAADAQAYREGLQELNERLDETIFLAKVGGTTASVVRETAHVAGVGVGFVMGGPAGGAAVNQGLRMVEGATEELTKVAMGEQSYEEAHDAFTERSKQALVESSITLVAGAAGSKLNKVVGAMSGPVAAKTVDIVGTGLVQSGGTAIQIGVEFAQAKSEFDKENAGLTGAERERAYKDFMAQNGFTLEQVSKRLGVSFGAGAAAKVLGGLAKKFGDETEEFTSELGEQIGHGQPLTAETLVAAAVGSHATKRGVQSSADAQNGGIAPPAPNDPPHVKAAASKVEETQAAYEAAKASGQNVEAAEAAYKSAISHDNAVRQDHVDKPVEKPSTVVENARNQLFERLNQAPNVEVTSVSEKGTRDPILPNGTRVAATTGYRDVTFKDAQGNTQQGIAFRGDSGKTEMGSVLHMYDKVNLPGNEKLKALLPEFKGKFEKDGVTYLVFEKLSGDKPLNDFDQLPDAAQRQLAEILKPEFLESVRNTGLNQSRIFEADYIFEQPDGTVRMGIPFRAFDFSTELPKMFEVDSGLLNSGPPNVPDDPNFDPSQSFDPMDPAGLSKDTSNRGLAPTHRSVEERLASLSAAELEDLNANMGLNDTERASKIAQQLNLSAGDPKVQQLLELHRDPRYPGTLEGSTTDLQNKIDDAMEILIPGYKEMSPDQRRDHAPERRMAVGLVRTGVLGVASSVVKGMTEVTARIGLTLAQRKLDLMMSIQAIMGPKSRIAGSDIWKSQVSNSLDAIHRNLGRLGFKSRMTHDSFSDRFILELIGGGNTPTGRAVANMHRAWNGEFKGGVDGAGESSDAPRPEGQPLRIILDPIGAMNLGAAGSYSQDRRTISLSSVDGWPSVVDATFAHEGSHAFNHRRRLQAMQLRTEGRFEDAAKLQRPDDGVMFREEYGNALGFMTVSDPAKKVGGYENFQSFDESRATLTGAANILDDATQAGGLTEAKLTRAVGYLHRAENLVHRTQDVLGPVPRDVSRLRDFRSGRGGTYWLFDKVENNLRGETYERSSLDWGVDADGFVIARITTISWISYKSPSKTEIDPKFQHFERWDSVRIPLLGARDISDGSRAENERLLVEQLRRLDAVHESQKTQIDRFKERVEDLWPHSWGYPAGYTFPAGSPKQTRQPATRPLEYRSIDDIPNERISAIQRMGLSLETRLYYGVDRDEGAQRIVSSSDTSKALVALDNNSTGQFFVPENPDHFREIQFDYQESPSFGGVPSMKGIVGAKGAPSPGLTFFTDRSIATSNTGPDGIVVSTTVGEAIQQGMSIGSSVYSNAERKILYVYSNPDTIRGSLIVSLESGADNSTNPGTDNSSPKPFDPTTLDRPDSPLMFQPNSPYVRSGLVGRTNLSETNESLRRVYTDRPAMAAEFSTMENPPKLMHGSTSASLLMYITPQNQTGKEQTAQDQLRSLNRQGQLRPSGAIEASLGAVFSGEIVFGKSNTDIAVVDVTDIGTALRYAEGRHAGHSNSMNWSPEIAHQRIADANERMAKEEKMAQEGGYSEGYKNSPAARRNKGTKATEDLRLAEWEKLSPLEKSLVSEQFPVVYGIDTSRQDAVTVPFVSDIRSELRLQGGTTGDEIRAVFVPKDKIPFVQLLVGDNGPRVLDIDLLNPTSGRNQPNQSDGAPNEDVFEPDDMAFEPTGPGLGPTHRSPEDRLRSLSPEQRKELSNNMKLGDPERAAKLAERLGLLPNDPRLERLMELHSDPRYPGTLEASTRQLQEKINDAMEILVPGYKGLPPGERRAYAAERGEVVDLVRKGVLGEAKPKVLEMVAANIENIKSGIFRGHSAADALANLLVERRALMEVLNSNPLNRDIVDRLHVNDRAGAKQLIDERIDQLLGESDSPKVQEELRQLEKVQKNLEARDALAQAYPQHEGLTRDNPVMPFEDVESGLAFLLTQPQFKGQQISPDLLNLGRFGSVQFKIGDYTVRLDPSHGRNDPGENVPHIDVWNENDPAAPSFKLYQENGAWKIN